MPLIEYTTQDSATVVVEVSESQAVGRLVRAGRNGDVIARASISLDQALARIRPAADALVDAVSALARRPDEFEIEFGIKLSAEAGAVIATSAIEANFTVHLKWSGRDRPGTLKGDDTVGTAPAS